MANRKWQYTGTIQDKSFWDNIGGPGPGLFDWLIKFGDDGWEPVAAVPTPKGDIAYYFKRPKAATTAKTAAPGRAVKRSRRR